MVNNSELIPFLHANARLHDFLRASRSYSTPQSDTLRSSLHHVSQIISQNLTSVSTQLATHGPLLSSLAAYPLPNYPGRDQEIILHKILRKKLEPQVEDWVEEGRATGATLTAQGGKEELLELWEWAGMAANEQARKHEWGGEYTLEEVEGGIENVVTGLEGRLGEESEGEEEENEDNGEGKEVMKGVALENVLRFMATGVEVVEEERSEEPPKIKFMT